jgi:hypothetical protein
MPDFCNNIASSRQVSDILVDSELELIEIIRDIRYLIELK